MAIPEPRDLGTYFRGDTVTFTVPCLRDGTVLNLTNATVWATFKVSRSDDDGETPGFQLSTGTSGIFVDDPLNGVVRVKIAATDTVNLPSTTQLVWDVQVRTDDGDVSTHDHGTIVFEEDVTRVTA